MANQFDEYTIGAISINGTQLNAPDQFNENPDITLIRYRSSGRIDYGYSVTATAAPKFSFTTPEVSTVLGLTGMQGVAIGTTVVIYWTLKNAVARSTGSDHLTTTINDGIVIPTTLSWNGPAAAWQIGVNVMANWDGTNEPFIYGTASLPALGLMADSFTGGKITVNGTEVDCWQNCTLNFGIQANQRFHKGQPYPARCEVTVAEPSLEITNLNPVQRSTFGLYGTRVTACNLFLRKNMATDGQTPTRELDASLVHIKIAGVDGIVHPLTTTASDGQSAQQGVRLVFDENASTASLVLTTSQAIS